MSTVYVGSDDVVDAFRMPTPVTVPVRSSSLVRTERAASWPTSTRSTWLSGTVVDTVYPSSPMTVMTADVEDASTSSPAAIDTAATVPAIGW